MHISILKKYFGLLKAVFKASFIADLEFRVNFFNRILTDILWYGAQIGTFQVLFMHTPVIGHWTAPQVNVFLGVLFVIDAIYMIFMHDTLNDFSTKVANGELDLILAKPINSQFMVSFQRIHTAMFGNLLIATSWLSYSILQLPDFKWLNLLWLIILIPSSVCVLYGVRFMMASISVIFTRAENVQFIWYQLYKLGMRPDSIYVPWVKFIIMTIVPVGIVASVPARALLDPPDFLLFAWAPTLAVIIIWMSHRFWNYSLKHYSSASS